MPTPKVVAITGSIGSGKSLIGKLLEDRGFTVMDTDAVVHNLFDNSEELKRQIADRFGDSVIATNNTVDRKKLGAVVFDDPIARRDLERIVHPAVLNACDRILDTLPGDKPVFMLVPLLFEAGLEKRYHEIWTVITDERILRERLTKRNGFTDQEITKRLSAQMPQPEKARRSDRVINNSGSFADTETQLNGVLGSFLGTT